jgi:predicted DCC family thiol-disulfide oxidoreductase YuxK
MSGASETAPGLATGDKVILFDGVCRLYDRIALNRYKLFGRYDACVIPDKDHDSRFLGG